MLSISVELLDKNLFESFYTVMVVLTVHLLQILEMLNAKTLNFCHFGAQR